MTPRTYLARTDQDIQEQVLEELRADPYVDTSQITVSVEEGLVVLEGSVASYEAINEATLDAWSVEGTVEVDNRLTVSPAAEEEGPTDYELSANIVSALDQNPAIDSTNINIDVAAGVVFITGTVPTYWQKVRVENLIGTLRGIVAIRNELAVTPVQEFTDEAVAEDIVASLERNYMLDTGTINIMVEAGSVTVSGSVSTYAAKTAAMRAVSRTRGVLDVRDKLAVRS